MSAKAIPAASKAQLAKLRKQADKYFAQFKESELKKFPCPHCQGENLSRFPKTSGEKWDSLCTCYHCGALFMKVVSKSRLKAWIPDFGGGSK
jgi:transcription elongation factor Elf1